MKISNKAQLNYNLYEELSLSHKETLINTSKSFWYNRSYKVFSEHPVNSIDDFLKIIAFAYSWMPTIPSIDIKGLESVESKLHSELEKLKRGQGNVEWLFKTLVPIINNSVVGVSKILHFIAPNEVAIYDSKVVEAWCRLFENDRRLRLQYRRGGDIGKVIFYNLKMQEWLKKCKIHDKDIKLRDLEILLYHHGNSIL